MSESYITVLSGPQCQGQGRVSNHDCVAIMIDAPYVINHISVKSSYHMKVKVIVVCSVKDFKIEDLKIH